MPIEIKKGKIIDLDKKYIIEDLDINIYSGEIYAVLKNTENDLLIFMPIDKIYNALLEQEKKKNIKEQEQKIEPTEKPKPESKPTTDETTEPTNKTIEPTDKIINNKPDKTTDNKLLAEAERKLEIIQAVINAKSTKEKKEIAKKYNVSLVTIYRWIKKYKENGRTIYGLIPKYKKYNEKDKNRNRKKIKGRTLEIIDKIVKEKYKNKTIPIKDLYEEINEILIKEKLKPVSYITLLKYIENTKNNK